MLKRTFLIAALLVAGVISSQAQEAPAGAPFKVEIKGDAIETAVFSATATRELRRTTARDAAMEFVLAFAQDSDSPEHKALRAKSDALIAEFSHRMRCKVMEETLVNKLEAADKANKEKEASASGSKVARKTLPFAVIGEEKQADGKVLVTLERFTEVTSTDAEGKTSVSRESEQQRLLCVKQGELWAIERHETLDIDWSAEGKTGDEPARKWQVQETLKQWFVYGLTFGVLDVKVDNSGAEASARSLLTQLGGFGLQFALFFHFVGRMAPAIMEVARPLFTPESWKAAEAAAKADYEKGLKDTKERAKDEPLRAIEKHEKPEAGVETFLFAPQNEWGGKHWLKMKKTEQGWKCVEAKRFVRNQVYDKEGKMTETWDEKSVEKFSDLDW